MREVNQLVGPKISKGYTELSNHFRFFLRVQSKRPDGALRIKSSWRQSNHCFLGPKIQYLLNDMNIRSVLKHIWLQGPLNGKHDVVDLI